MKDFYAARHNQAEGEMKDALIALPFLISNKNKNFILARMWSKLKQCTIFLLIKFLMFNSKEMKKKNCE